MATPRPPRLRNIVAIGTLGEPPSKGAALGPHSGIVAIRTLGEPPTEARH